MLANFWVLWGNAIRKVCSATCDGRISEGVALQSKVRQEQLSYIWLSIGALSAAAWGRETRFIQVCCVCVWERKSAKGCLVFGSADAVITPGKNDDQCQIVHAWQVLQVADDQAKRLRWFCRSGLHHYRGRWSPSTPKWIVHCLVHAELAPFPLVVAAANLHCQMLRAVNHYTLTTLFFL